MLSDIPETPATGTRWKDSRTGWTSECMGSCLCYGDGKGCTVLMRYKLKRRWKVFGVNIEWFYKVMTAVD